MLRRIGQIGLATAKTAGCTDEGWSLSARLKRARTDLQPMVTSGAAMGEKGMLKQAVRIALACAFVSTALGGCIYEATIKIPCASAGECVSIIARKDQVCDWNGKGDDDAYFLANADEQKSIYVAYEHLIRHLGTVAPDERAIKPVIVGQNAERMLGCRRSKPTSGEVFDEHSFTVKAACYADQCPSADAATPKPTRPVSTTCERLCDAGDKSCIKHALSEQTTSQMVTQELTTLFRDLSTPVGPKSLDLRGVETLSNHYTGTKTCRRSPLQVDTIADTFRNTGSTCRMGFAVSHSEVNTLVLSLPGEYQGRWTLDGQQGFNLDSSDPIYAPLLTLSGPALSPVNERIAAIHGRRSPGQYRLIFSGAKYYCSQLSWRHE
jgi:hypothetical protein